MKKRTLPLLVFCLLLTLLLAACGSDAESAASDSTVEEETSEEENSEETAEEDSEEEEEEEEEEEPTTDEIFAESIEGREGVCLKLRIYNQKGTPVRYGLVTITDGSQNLEAETDYDGYALFTDLLLDTEYSLSVSDRDDAPVGAVQLTIIEGDTYAGALREDGEIVVSVADGDTSVADISIVATDENGEDSAFDCYSVDVWEYTPESEDEEDSEEEETEEAEES